MNNMKQIKKDLINYKSMENAIENLKEERELLADTSKGMNTQKENIQGGGGFHSEVEDAVMEIEEITKRIKTIEFKIRRIDRALEGLTDTECIVIKKFYIGNKKIWQFMDELDISEATINRVKGKALRKMETAIYGKIS